jgi:hypothetical protein
MKSDAWYLCRGRVEPCPSSTMLRLAGCQSFPKILVIHSQWWQGAVDDYLKQASKLTDLNSKIIGSLIGPVAAR